MGHDGNASHDAENMTFVSRMFVSGGGNTGYALYTPYAYGTTINLDHASIDYWGADHLHGLLEPYLGTARCSSTLGT